MKKMRRCFSLLLSVLLIAVSMPLHALGASLPFRDVPENAWYRSAVEYVYNRGLFNGTSPDTFSPGNSMNRAMFMQVLYNFSSTKELGSSPAGFMDVPLNKWFFKPVTWAASHRLTTGTGEGYFSPEDSITREQMIVILYNFVKATDNDSSYTGDRHLSFPDYGRVSSWAKTPMAWALNNNIINGSGGAINPKGISTRAEVATMFRNADSYLVKDSVPGGEIAPEPVAELGALHMNFSTLKQGGYFQFEEEFSGGKVYHFYDYPNAEYVFPPDHSDLTPPAALLAYAGRILPDFAARSLSTLRQHVTNYSMEYDQENYFGSPSGYYITFLWQGFRFLIPLENNQTLSYTDAVQVSFDRGEPDPTPTPKPTSTPKPTPAPSAGDPLEALGLSFSTLKAGGYTKYDEYYNGGPVYHFDDYPTADYVFNLGHGNGDKPAGLLANAEDVLADYVGLSLQSLSQKVENYEYFNVADSIYDSPSGYAASFHLNGVQFVVMLNNASRLSGNDFVQANLAQLPPQPEQTNPLDALRLPFSTLQAGGYSLYDEYYNGGKVYSFDNYPDADYVFSPDHGSGDLPSALLSTARVVLEEYAGYSLKYLSQILENYELHEDIGFFNPPSGYYITFNLDGVHFIVLLNDGDSLSYDDFVQANLPQ